VITAFYDHPGLAVVNLRTKQVVRLDVGPEPGAVAFTRHGHAAWVAGGAAEGTLTRVDLKTGRVHPPIAVGSHPRGLALHPDGKHAVVALNGEAAVAVVTLATGKVRRMRTRPFPHRVAVAPDGRHALVTHNGFGDRVITPIDLVRHRARPPARVGKDPVAVAYTRSGRRAIVALADAGAVTVVDGRTGRRRRTLKHLGAPQAVAVAGRRAIIADGRTGQLRRLRLGANA
jgi:DNA-binding beta-propeller fold protein YncE